MDLLTKYPHALEQLAILKKDYLGVDTAAELSYSIQVGQHRGLDMFQMFTDAGNAAVAEIVRKTMEWAEDRNTAYGWIYAELEQLQTIAAFAEATDTAVREAVWDAVCAALPEPVFKTVRA